MNLETENDSMNNEQKQSRRMKSIKNIMREVEVGAMTMKKIKE